MKGSVHLLTREGVNGHGGEAESQAEHPELEIGTVLEEFADGKSIGFGIATITVDAIENKGGLLVSQEFVLVGEVDDQEHGKEAESWKRKSRSACFDLTSRGHALTDSQDTEEKEDPAPSLESGDSIHQRHSVTDQV